MKMACAFPVAVARPALSQVEPANAILLVAKPDLVDPNFRETVVLVTQAEDGEHRGRDPQPPDGSASTSKPARRFTSAGR